MSRQVIIVIEVDDSVTNDQLHENLCQHIHETVQDESIIDIQVVGDIITSAEG